MLNILSLLNTFFIFQFAVYLLLFILYIFVIIWSSAMNIPKTLLTLKILFQDSATVEWVDDRNLPHLRRLLYLSNPNLIRLLAVNPCGSQVEVVRTN